MADKNSTASTIENEDDIIKNAKIEAEKIIENAKTEAKKQAEAETKKIIEDAKAEAKKQAEAETKKIMDAAKEENEKRLKVAMSQNKSKSDVAVVFLPLKKGETHKTVGLNGKIYQIKRGENVTVPVGVAEIIRNSQSEDAKTMIKINELKELSESQR